jgi:TetR/AcrR family transcriptional repressor of lmrAB and yxaGH operons
VSAPDGRTTTRTRLIDAAIDEFLHVGPGNTSWGDVCAAAGTTKGVVHHHFPGGKEELIVAAVERNAAHVDRLLARVHDGGDAGPTDAGAALVRFFDLYAELLDADPDRGCPVAASVVDASATSEAVRRATVDAFTGWIDALATLVGDRDVASTVVATMEGSILLARVTRDPDLLRRTGRVLAAQLGT